jgi:hypothetical protein
MLAGLVDVCCLLVEAVVEMRGVLCIAVAGVFTIAGIGLMDAVVPAGHCKRNTPQHNQTKRVN